MYLDHLFVRELGAIVDEGEGMIRVAVSTESGLGDSATVNLHRGSVVAEVALEESFPHLGDQSGQTNHHAANADQLVNV